MPEKPCTQGDMVGQACGVIHAQLDNLTKNMDHLVTKVDSLPCNAHSTSIAMLEQAASTLNATLKEIRKDLRVAIGLRSQVRLQWVLTSTMVLMVGVMAAKAFLIL